MTIGHNASDDRLRLLIERVERLEEEKKGIADDIRDVYAEAKAVGYDVKIMRQIVRLRKMRPDDRREMEMVLDTYKAALGMDYIETPLGAAALAAATRLENSPIPTEITTSAGSYKNKAAREMESE